MEAEDAVHALKRPLLDHDPGSAAGAVLLGGLKQQAHRAGQLVPNLRQDARRGEQPCHVPVVSAGVHDAVVLGSVLDVVFLVDGQGVDVRAQGHAPAGTGALDVGDQAA